VLLKQLIMISIIAVKSFILKTAVTRAKPQRSQRKPNTYRNIPFYPFGERLRLHKMLFLLRSVVAPLRELLFTGSFSFSLSGQQPGVTITEPAAVTLAYPKGGIYRAPLLHGSIDLLDNLCGF